MSYKAALNEVGDEDFPSTVGNEVLIKCFGKRKVPDGNEDSDDENHKRVRSSWSKEKTARLLELVKLNKDRLLDKSEPRRNPPVWNDILQELQIYDINLTLIQVKKKWKNMVEAYKSYKENMKTGGNPGLRKPDFFEAVGEVVRMENYTSFELSYSEPNVLADEQSKGNTDMGLNSREENRVNFEQDLLADNSPESPDGSREEKHSRKRKKPKIFESVEDSIRKMVETSESAVEMDQMRLKYLEAQSIRQDKFDRQVLEAFKERTLSIKKTSHVISELKGMLGEHMKLVKDVDDRTKMMEKFIDNHFKLKAE